MNPVTAVNSFRTRVFRSALTRPANTDAYAAGDVISAVTTNAHFTFGTALSGAMVGDQKKLGRPGFLSGAINALRLHSSANQATKLDAQLFLFHTDITAVADNAAFAPTDAEMLTLVGVIDIPSYSWSVGAAAAGADGNAVAEIKNIDLPYITGVTGQLFGQLVARNAYVPVSGEMLTIDLVVTPD